MTKFVVWVAGKEAMERYGTYHTLEKAKEVADALRQVEAGTIYVEKVVSEKVYCPREE